jgi:hypothetical protein
MKLTDFISYSIQNWELWFVIIAFFYAGYNLAEHKYYEKGYKHGYNRAKAIYGKGTLK